MNRRIVILGFMACGKTTVAKELARQLDCNYVDLDSFITERHGRSPAEIIQQDGEETFRELETLALRDVLQNKDARVIALGGGTWTIPANRTLAALHECEAVWLDVPFEICWNRIVAAATARPLAPDRESAWSRYESRRADYALSNRRVAATESDSVKDIAAQVAKEL
ncbi:MAG TPA: shikimate kinase [Pyrinomonadaceae bacterium]|nr:shikimate kinase [Pyrinomonadaceae bacterium]